MFLKNYLLSRCCLVTLLLGVTIRSSVAEPYRFVFNNSSIWDETNKIEMKSFHDVAEDLKGKGKIEASEFLYNLLAPQDKKHSATSLGELLLGLKNMGALKALVDDVNFSPFLENSRHWLSYSETMDDLNAQIRHTDRQIELLKQSAIDKAVGSMEGLSKDISSFTQIVKRLTWLATNLNEPVSIEKVEDLKGLLKGMKRHMVLVVEDLTDLECEEDSTNGPEYQEKLKYVKAFLNKIKRFLGLMDHFVQNIHPKENTLDIERNITFCEEVVKDPLPEASKFIDIDLYDSTQNLKNDIQSHFYVVAETLVTKPTSAIENHLKNETIFEFGNRAAKLHTDVENSVKSVKSMQERLQKLRTAQAAIVQMIDELDIKNADQRTLLQQIPGNIPNIESQVRSLVLKASEFINTGNMIADLYEYTEKEAKDFTRHPNILARSIVAYTKLIFSLDLILDHNKNFTALSKDIKDAVEKLQNSASNYTEIAKQIALINV